MKRTIQTAIVLAITAAALALLSSCATRRSKAVPMVRTVTTLSGSQVASRGLVGSAGAGATTVTETPYESPAYREAGAAMFSRQ